jgi:hypothetical protein
MMPGLGCWLQGLIVVQKFSAGMLFACVKNHCHGAMGVFLATLLEASQSHLANCVPLCSNDTLYLNGNDNSF